ncbi:glutathione S-transferase family protein [Candidatus Persebacteraceae bacterium Df01]|jgi:glutathione S-transferase|uniref:Glutathione S-transferase family protein n=1 Tax=Candidatus Doriopsillibacter californiensis TaxID=2970740 RepID=A0ABT7QL90_9GAMM|nr:glutathione S-transferase family protein [Candidatus Persebacteraceae bacterium Df01]
MKLFGHPYSGHALKVKFFLAWLEIEHQYECVDIFSERSTRSDEFLKASKFSEVPTLIDDGQCYIQSNAILVYLSDKFRQFKNSNEKQKCLEWLVWEANKIGMCLPQLRANEKLSKTYPEFRLSQGAHDWLSIRYKHDVGVLDKELADKSFILGNSISPADFSLSAYLMYSDEVSIEVPQNVERWLDRLRKQKGWQSPYEMLKG